MRLNSRKQYDLINCKWDIYRRGKEVPTFGSSTKLTVMYLVVGYDILGCGVLNLDNEGN